MAPPACERQAAAGHSADLVRARSGAGHSLAGSVGIGVGIVIGSVALLATGTVVAAAATPAADASAPPPPSQPTATVIAAALPPANVGGAAHGSITPASQSVAIGRSARLTVTPAAGYTPVLRGTCGGTLNGNTYTTRAVTAGCSVTATFARKSVLFVGNSFSYGHAEANGAFYNNTAVTSLVPATDTPSGAASPQPWAGVAGIFKRLSDEAGLEYDVSLSAAPGIRFRTHYLNLYNGWDLLGNIASQRWSVVVLQSRSDEPVPDARSSGNQAWFNTYADRLERYIHHGAAETYTETQAIGGGSAAVCAALARTTVAECNATRSVPANPHASAATDVLLYATWPRPDATNLGAGSVYPDTGIATMAQDLHDSYFRRFTANGRFKAVVAAGDAFMRAIASGVAAPNAYAPGDLVNLWGIDYYHASRAGYYLSALVQLGMIGGVSPKLGYAADGAAAGLGLSPAAALALQQVAFDSLVPAAPAVARVAAGDGRVRVTVQAPDNVGRLPLLGYTVATAQAPSSTCTTVAPATACSITGLRNGTPYTFTVQAHNAVGPGVASAVSAAVVPTAAGRRATAAAGR